MSAPPLLLLDGSLTMPAPGASGRTLLFEQPEQVVAVYQPHKVEAGLGAVAEGLARGLHAAGFFAYELGYCLEPKLQALLPPDRQQPLFWIGMFPEPRRFEGAETRHWLDPHRLMDSPACSGFPTLWN